LRPCLIIIQKNSPKVILRFFLEYL
jgi:hypothetical protein